MYFFFFKQKTAYEMRISDWSSDVCSSDLRTRVDVDRAGGARQDCRGGADQAYQDEQRAHGASMPSKARDGPALFEIIGPKRDIRMNPPLTMMKQMGVAGGARPRFHRLAPHGFLSTPLRHPIFLPWL